MPAKTDKQRKFMCAELGRKRRGEATKTRMTEKQLVDFCRDGKPRKYRGKENR